MDRVFPATLPFEARVLAFLTDHPGDTVEACATSLGLSPAAVLTACVSLEAKGLVAWPAEEAPDAR